MGISNHKQHRNESHSSHNGESLQQLPLPAVDNSEVRAAQCYSNICFTCAIQANQTVIERLLLYIAQMEHQEEYK